MRLRYPWSVLGIEPTDDQRAIRKAYAVKLKTTRPDEDPAGFQALLEARDQALRESQYVKREVPEEENEPAELIDAVLDQPGRETESPASEHEAPVTIVLNPGSIPVPPREEPGVIVMSPHDVQVTDLVDAEDARLDVERLLDEVGKPHPWRNLKSQWAAVFDGLEQVSFEQYSYLMWAMLNRLVGDLQKAVGDIPDVTNWQVDPKMGDRSLLGAYADILRDFESRFQFLKQDTALLEYLDEDEARDLINALTIAVGRSRADQVNVRPIVNVEDIHAGFIDAAFGDDIAMQAFYQKARQNDKFPWTFSILALLFPTIFAIHYRLYGAALLSVIAAIGYVGLNAANEKGVDAPFAPLAAGLYLIVAFSLAFNWRQMRLNLLSRKIKNLTLKGHDSYAIKQKLQAWGQPNWIWTWGPFLVILLAKSGMFFGPLVTSALGK